jgi:tryptophan synthase alpha subunit
MIKYNLTAARHVPKLAGIGLAFAYLVSIEGVTGQDRGPGKNLKERIARLREWT